MANKQFEKDFFAVKQIHQELEYSILSDSKYKYRIDGILNITDSEGTKRGAFRVSIYFKETYPLGFAELQEVSNFIPRMADRHINKNGFCCVCGPIEKAINEQKPLTIADFITFYAIPFFANQIHFEEFGFFLNGEYSHDKKGFWESLEEEFKTKDVHQINEIIKFIKSRPSVNAKCYCGSGKKLKHCHFSRIRILRNTLKAFNL